MLHHPAGHYRRRRQGWHVCCKVSIPWPKRSPKPVSADEARKVAEEARESEWQAPSFLKQIFLGNFRLDLVHPFPPSAARAARVPRVHGRGSSGFLVEEVDSRRDRPRGQDPAVGHQGARRARRLRDEDPEGVRRPGLHAARVRRRDEAHHAPRRQPRHAAVGAPVDRRPAAAEALRDAGAEEEVPSRGSRAARSRRSR